MRFVSLKACGMLSLVVLASALMSGCGSTNPSSTGSSQPSSQPGTITLTAGAFAPYITVVNTGATVTWKNADSAAHTIKSTPKPTDPKGDNSGYSYDPSAFLNPDPIAQQVAAGASVTQTFTKPGLYDFYDPTVATWDADLSRVAANSGAPGYPKAMEGVIWVQGNIPNLPTSAKNGVLAGNDDFLFDFVAVQKGGSVTWHNFDTDKHFATPMPGWSTPINPAPMGDGLNLIKGTDDAPPQGGDTTITFTTPGLYYYYCTAHADPDQATRRAVAHGGDDKTSVYPVVMEGFVLVNG